MRLMTNDGVIAVESCAGIADARGTVLQLRSSLCGANCHDPAPGFALLIVLGIERRTARSFGDTVAGPTVNRRISVQIVANPAS
jgi:hypothetical protein